MSVLLKPQLIGLPNAVGSQGYNLLGKHLCEKGLSLNGWRATPIQRLAVKALRRLPRFGGLSPPSAWDLFAAERTVRKNGRGVHFLWGDEFLPRFSRPAQAIFTLHNPMELWCKPSTLTLPLTRGIVTMADRESEKLKRCYPKLPVRYIRLAIDLAFWHPITCLSAGSPKVIAVVGRYMRNFDMLIRVAESLLKQRADIRFRWLVNPDFVLPDEVVRRLPSDRFELVRGLSAEALRHFYRESWLFFTPYDNVTASNAIVEALACGVPVFTTNVGGMRGYCPNMGGVLVENNDELAMIAAINDCLDSPEKRARLAAEARKVAVVTLGWDQAVNAHLEFYKEIDAAQNSRCRLS
jgi:glycosyltransferase involved in cell wall biosynthesis